jgi:glycosyltransferase involved in cell wall biosynthesis
MSPRLTAIVPIRNRSGERLENCLRSLRWQEGLDAADIEIVISDFGSDVAHRASIDALGERYDAKVEFTDTKEVWNRSRALNIGLQAATGHIAFCTDVDMIFAPNFLAKILETHEQFGGQVMALCRCNDLLEDVPLQVWNRSDFETLEARSERRETTGTGACQAAPLEFFLPRGYDEKFLYWGAEDVDMSSRAEHYGLHLQWMDGTTMLHQWHPTMKRDRPVRCYINRFRYKLTKHVVVKNRRRWGNRE